MVGLRMVVLGLGLFLLAGCAQTPAPATAPVSPAVTPAGTAVAPAASQATAVPGPVVTAAARQATAPAPSAGGGTPASRPLFVEVAAPAADTFEVPANTRSVVIAGRTNPGAVVSVNGALAKVDAAGLFQIEVGLTDEVTLVEVVATDSAGREVRTDRIVVRD